MKTIAFLIPASLLALAPLAASPALAAPGPVQKAAVDPHAKAGRASIPFANHGGVQNWRADGTRVVYFEDRHRQWYRAELMGTAIDLPFVENIGIVSGPGGSLDRFGGVIVRGQRYMFTSFAAVDGPPAKKAHKATGAPAAS